MSTDEDLFKLIEKLPFFIREVLYNHPNKKNLIEIVMDLGRRPEARFLSGPEYLSQKPISWQDLDYTIKQIEEFNDDNRAGIERTLHRISCIRNRQSIINGLTCRIGRAIFGTISGIRDLLESGQSLLLLGKPGVGKTTVIREIARVLSDEMEKRVIVIDTSNEIAGDSDIPHFGIGRARRMQVRKTELQHQVMIEAIENHMPEVIIIDEIGTELESLAARTIAERGVQLVGTAHGNSLESLIKNPPLSDLIGGIQYVTLSDEEAKRRGTQKSILERKAYPAFQLAIEINQQNSWTIHQNVEESVDFLLQGQEPRFQTRNLELNGQTKINDTGLTKTTLSFFNHKLKKIKKNKFEEIESRQIRTQKSKFQINPALQEIKIYPYGLCNKLIIDVAKINSMRIKTTKKIIDADIIIGPENYLQQNPKIKIFAKKNKVRLLGIQSRTVFNVTQTLLNVLKLE